MDLDTILGRMSDLDRMVLAGVTAFLFMLLVCPVAIALFRKIGIAERSDKTDSEFLAGRHDLKRGTVTMGGMVLIAAVLFASALWAGWDGILLPTLAGVVVLFGAIGVLDDFIKIRHPVLKGLKIRTKLILQGAVALMAATLVYSYHVAQGSETGIMIQLPFVGWGISIGPLFILVAVVVLTGSANAVNLTDGLDGLASGLLVLAFSAVGVLAYIAGSVDLSSSYNVLFVPGAVEAAVFSWALVGAALGFLLFNRHPARIFMGDTGALAMGGALGMLAVSIRQELLLLVIGGVFVAEALSVLLQIWYFKKHGERIFLCAPLHHHFEHKHWPETRITRRFWLVGAVLSAVAVFGTLGGF